VYTANKTHRKGNPVNRRRFLTTSTTAAALSLLTTAGCTTTGTGSGDPEARRASIDAGADSALSRLYEQAAGSRELVSAARGTLVFPSVVSAGFIVGGTHGSGALRKAGKTAGYFSMTAASVGLLAGAQSKSVFILFMNQDALARFEAGSGWTVGVDGSVALISVGANAGINTRDIQQPIIGFVLTNAGFMADFSMNGTRIGRLSL
jgi:lipid-binding SYLF domain-containing protein